MSSCAPPPACTISVGWRAGKSTIKPACGLLKRIDPGKPIPRTTAEIGRPVIHYKLGMNNEPVQVENISATGMALRFQMEDPETRPVDLDKGSQLLCLVIYAMDKKGEKLITFWCTCEVIDLFARHHGRGPL